jgi:hypothetical protein
MKKKVLDKNDLEIEVMAEAIMKKVIKRILQSDVEKLVETQRGKNLFLISYDKHLKNVSSEIVRYRILFLLKIHGAFIHKEPVETTILFSSDKSSWDWTELIRRKAYTQGLSLVLVEVTPSDIKEIYLKKSDPSLQMGLEEDVATVMSVIKNPTIEAIEKLLLPPEFRTHQ